MAARGIQPGTVAGDAEAWALDKALREATTICRAKFPTLTWAPTVSATYLQTKFGVSSRLVGSSPDGGVWSKTDGTIVLATEAKKQGRGGNAVERAFKNIDVFERLGCKNYALFCTGPGFFDGHFAERVVNTAYCLRNLVDAQWNVPGAGLSVYRYPAPTVEGLVNDLSALLSTVTT